MRSEIQSFLGHWCPFFFHFLSVLFIFRVLYLLASFHPSVHLLSLFFVTLEILYPEWRKCGFKWLLKGTRYLSDVSFATLLGGRQLGRKVPVILQGLSFLYRRFIFISGSKLLWKIDGRNSVSGLYKCFLICQDSKSRKGVEECQWRLFLPGT